MSDPSFTTPTARPNPHDGRPDSTSVRATTLACSSPSSASARTEHPPPRLTFFVAKQILSPATPPGRGYMIPAGLEDVAHLQNSDDFVPSVDAVKAVAEANLCKSLFAVKPRHLQMILEQCTANVNAATKTIALVEEDYSILVSNERAVKGEMDKEEAILLNSQQRMAELTFDYESIVQDKTNNRLLCKKATFDLQRAQNMSRCTHDLISTKMEDRPWGAKSGVQIDTVYKTIGCETYEHVKKKKGTGMVDVIYAVLYNTGWISSPFYVQIVLTSPYIKQKYRSGQPLTRWFRTQDEGIERICDSLGIKIPVQESVPTGVHLAYGGSIVDSRTPASSAKKRPAEMTVHESCAAKKRRLDAEMKAFQDERDAIPDSDDAQVNNDK